jgi:NAD(P)-dependent dehydrogenase (short-subunit alcohol dehydrogenase family)
MGEAAAELLLRLDARVYAVGGSRHTIDLPVERAFQADLGSKEAIDALLKELPEKIDALFLCHGIAQRKGIEIQVQKVNFLSFKYMTEALLPRIADRGSVTFISSSGGYNWRKNLKNCKSVIDCKTYEETVNWYEAHPEAIVNSYMFSKQCQNTYVKYKVFAPEFITRKIRLNAVCPGTTITGLTDDFFRNTSPTGNIEEGRASIERSLLKRWNGHWASSEEMGWPLVAIGSRLFSYMSGEVIGIDYGVGSTFEMDGLLAGISGE